MYNYVALSWFDPEHVDFPVARKVEVLSDEEPAPALTQVLGPTGDDGWWYVSMAGTTDLWIFMSKHNRMSSQLAISCRETLLNKEYKVGLKEAARDT